MSGLASYFQANYFCASAWASADAAIIRHYMNIRSNLKITGFYSAIIPDFLHLILIKVRQSDSFDQTSIYQLLHFLYKKVYIHVVVVLMMSYGNNQKVLLFVWQSVLYTT